MQHHLYATRFVEAFRRALRLGQSVPILLRKDKKGKIWVPLDWEGPGSALTIEQVSCAT